MIAHLFSGYHSGWGGNETVGWMTRQVPLESRSAPHGYRGRSVNAFCQDLVLVKFNLIVALRSIEG